MNSKYQRLLSRLPDELLAVLGKTLANWKVLSYKPGGPGWVADIEIKGRKFRLSSEYNYIGVEELLGSSFRGITPPEDQRKSISPEQVAALINEAIA
jgi:hypothetical protein